MFHLPDILPLGEGLLQHFVALLLVAIVYFWVLANPEHAVDLVPVPKPSAPDHGLPPRKAIL